MNMPLPRPSLISRRLAAPLLVALLTLSGCGGGATSAGVGSNGTGSCVAPLLLNDGIVTGATVSTIVVDGVTLALDVPRAGDCGTGATVWDEFELDARPVSLPADPTGLHVDAYSIDAADGVSMLYLKADAIGPVDSVDAAGDTLTVFGQRIVVDSGTVFVGLPFRLAGLHPGDDVRVYGLYDQAAALYHATRVEALPTTPDHFALRATITALDTTAKTFMLGTRRISYANLSQPPALADGSLVLVSVAAMPTADGAWAALAASSIDLGIGASGTAADGSTVEGFIDTISDATHFTVRGLRIDASHATFSPPSPSLVVGSRVIVKGSMDAFVMTADAITVDGP